MKTIEVGDVVTAGNDVYKDGKLYADTGTRGLVRKVLNHPEGRVVLVSFHFSKILTEMPEDEVVFRSRRRCPICKDWDPFSTDEYMLKDEVWYQVMPTHKGHPHIACFEKKLGRHLREEDFRKDVPLNRMILLGIKIGKRTTNKE